MQHSQLYRLIGELKKTGVEPTHLTCHPTRLDHFKMLTSQNYGWLKLDPQADCPLDKFYVTRKEEAQ